MYILSDNFVGNIINTGKSKLKDNVFIYTNNGKNYKSVEINPQHIKSGILTTFYTYLTIHDFINKPLLNSLEQFLVNENDTKRLYIEITIDLNNNVLNALPCYKESVDFNAVVAPIERIVPLSTHYNYMHFEGVEACITNDTDLNNKQYIALLTFPNMKWNSNVDMYVFNHYFIGGYSSKEKDVAG